MWSSEVIFKPIKIYSKVIHLYFKKKLLPIPNPLSDGKITNETYGGKFMIYHAPWSFLLKGTLRETVRAALGTVYGQKNK